MADEFLTREIFSRLLPPGSNHVSRLQFVVLLCYHTVSTACFPLYHLVLSCYFILLQLIVCVLSRSGASSSFSLSSRKSSDSTAARNIPSFYPQRTTHCKDCHINNSSFIFGAIVVFISNHLLFPFTMKIWFTVKYVTGIRAAAALMEAESSPGLRQRSLSKLGTPNLSCKIVLVCASVIMNHWYCGRVHLQ